jgi:hypothetical protein
MTDDRDLPDVDVGPRRSSRNPWMGVVVSVLGLVLMGSMWRDVRWFLQPRTPTELGDVANLVTADGFTVALEDRYVTIDGVPDVRHAARITLKQGFASYLRLSEGGNLVFALVPRDAEAAPDEFPSRFTGRVRSIRSTSLAETVETYFAGTGALLSDALDRDGALSALASRSGVVPLADGGERSVDARSRISVAVDHPLVKVQLGVSTWSTQAEADAAIEALKVPWIRTDREADHAPERATLRSAHRSYVVALSAEGLESARASFAAAVAPDARAGDPKVGATLLPLRTTMLVSADAIAVEGDDVVITLPDGASAGYVVVGDRLVPAREHAPTLRVSKDRIASLELETPLSVAPNAVVIEVGRHPTEAWTTTLLFLVVAGLVVVNLAAVGLGIRRRLG